MIQKYILSLTVASIYISSILPCSYAQGSTLMQELKKSRSRSFDIGLINGRRYNIDNPRSKYDGLRIIWFTLTQNRLDIDILNVSRTGPANKIYEANTRKCDLAVLSAGFHDSDNRPIGLFVQNGQIISDLYYWKVGGIFYQRKEFFAIAHVRDWTPSSKIPNDLTYAIQSKPLIVEHAQNGIVRDNGKLFDRMAIGFTTNGDILVAGAFRSNGRAISLYDFGELLSIPKKEGGPDGRTVLGLEGGPGAHLYLPGVDNSHYGYDGEDFVVNTINIGRSCK